MKRWAWMGIAIASVCGLLLAQGTAALGAEHAFVGSKDCRKCHLKEYRSWQETTMAQAFELLKPGVRPEVKKEHGLDPDQDFTADATCLACHTTGYGKEGGFVSLEETPDLVGVGCEMCHGAGATYLQDGYMTLKNKEYKRAELVAVGLVHPITEAQCVNCHNTDNPMVGDDYVFDFETRKDEGTHEVFPLRYNHD